MKRNFWLILSLLLVLVLVGCSAPTEEAEMSDDALETEDMINEEDAMEEEAVEEEAMEEEAMTEEMLEMTYEALAKYNGQDGMPAYVAVEGVIYDVSDVAGWSGGKHKGNVAGVDVTDAIMNKSPHGAKKLEGLPIVGKIVE